MIKPNYSVAELPKKFISRNEKTNQNGGGVSVVPYEGIITQNKRKNENKTSNTLMLSKNYVCH